MSLRYGLKEYKLGNPCKVLISGYSYQAVIQRDLGDCIEVTTEKGVSVVPKSNTFPCSYYWYKDNV
ncbi:hypothetical protein Aeh1hmmORF07c [Aeromonas phage Aeh1]|uniref:Uncharacterized protein n=1 Tax=Aeromonas phage Aeh1 TaxID=2880362 RepID=Q76YE4_9CAUD|nr:hypothetical protein Aeh1p301 [Aeromonas phage Aeh1]AAQ17951.1 hypothetical protein Aeh1hmmORF07c [Aeromonas phage Aeh1]